MEFIATKLPLLLRKKTELNKELKTIFYQEQNNIFNEIYQMLKFEDDKNILKEYSKLTYSDFLFTDLCTE